MCWFLWPVAGLVWCADVLMRWFCGAGGRWCADLVALVAGLAADVLAGGRYSVRWPIFGLVRWPLVILGLIL